MAMVGYSQSEGDTQPLSPRVYDEFADRSKMAINSTQFASSNETNRETHESTGRSYLPGQIGHVDLVGGFEQPPDQLLEEVSQGQDDEEDPISQGAEFRAEIYPESNRFQAPKTPGTNGKVRSHKGYRPEHANMTPHLPLNPFANQIAKLDVMDASQAFKATQALSSPLVHVIHSDGLSERPSPDMYNMRPATAGSLSSPSRMTTLGTVRAAIEPQTTYISMQESQARRDHRLRQAELRQKSSASESSNDDFGFDDSQLRTRRLQRRIDLRAKDEFLGLTAPPRSHAKGRGRGQGRGGLYRSDKMGRGDSGSGNKATEALTISDEISAEENVTEDETDKEIDFPESTVGEMDELAEDNKENVEIPRTVRKENRLKVPSLAAPSFPSRRVHKNQMTADDIESLEPALNPRLMDQNHGFGATLQVTRSSPTSAIADSQLSPNHEKPASSRRALNDPTQAMDPQVDIPQSPPPDLIKTSSRLLATLSAMTASDPASPGIPVTYQSKNGTVLSLAKPRPIVDITTRDTSLTETDSVPSSAPLAVNSNNPAATIEEARILQRPKISEEIQTKKQGTSEALLKDQEEMCNEGDNFSHQTIIPPSLKAMHSSTLPSEIPETGSTTRRPLNSNDSLLSAKIGSSGSSVKPKTLSDSPIAGSTSFETAQTRLTSSFSASRSHRSPPKSGRSSLPLKTFGQIAADPSPLDPIGEIDVNINILSNEDVEFQNVINGSSPVNQVNKRRRGNSGRALIIMETERDSRLEPEPGPVPGSETPKPQSGLHPDRNKPPQPIDLGCKLRKAVKEDPSTLDELADENLPLNASPAMKKTLTHDQRSSGDRHPIESKTRIPQSRARKARPRGGGRVGRSSSSDRVQTKETSAGATKPMQTPNESPNILEPPNGRAHDKTIFAPNRVFAYFNGTRPAFYPATCVGFVEGNEPRFKICFDDGTVDTINSSYVKRLELHVGDLIKVDNLGSRTSTYVVQGLSDPRYPSAMQAPMVSTPGRMSQIGTDVFGNATLLASVKKRQSGDANDFDGKIHSIPMTDIYLTQGMWKNIKDREFKFSSIISPPFSRLQTPSETTSVSSSTTSHDQRLKVSGIGNLRSSLSSSIMGRGLFKNMVFAVTNILRQVDRDRTTRLIVSNGGHMLADDFNELFDIPELEIISASKPSPRKSTSSQFVLTPACQQIGFTCLIADKHCRKTKYIQALAIGIPCLATRWVRDCVGARRVLPWETYLLSSGESSFLGGAVRSRVLPTYSPTDITLPSIVNCRPRLLAGQSVLLVMSKDEEETMKNHPLFTHALGASKVSRVTTLDAAAKVLAKAYVDGEPWDWLYSHEDEVQAEKIVFGSNSGGRKRKRVWDDNGLQTEGKRRTRVVGNEFVIQSLILGRLLDTD